MLLGRLQEEDLEGVVVVGAPEDSRLALVLTAYTTKALIATNHAGFRRATRRSVLRHEISLKSAAQWPLQGRRLQAGGSTLRRPASATSLR